MLILLILLSTVFFMGSYVYLDGINSFFSPQDLPYWLIGANAAVWFFSVVLVLWIRSSSESRNHRPAHLIFALLFLYSFGLLMQLSNAHNMPPKTGDLAGLRKADQWVADSIYAHLTDSAYPAFESVPLSRVHSLAAQGNREAQSLLTSWEVRVNQSLKSRHLSARQQVALAHAYQELYEANPERVRQAQTVLELRTPNPFDLQPAWEKVDALIIRLLPVLYIWLVFALFAKGTGYLFGLTGGLLASALLTVSVTTRDNLLSSFSPHFFALLALTAGFLFVVFSTDEHKRKIWEWLFDGPWFRLHTLTLYIPFILSGVISVVLVFLVRNAGTGMAEVLKLPFAFLLMWVFYLMNRETYVAHDLYSRQQKLLLESPFFYPTRFLILLGLLYAPVALALWLDVGQAITLSLAVIFALIAVHRQVRGAVFTVGCSLALIYGTFRVLSDFDRWEPILQPYTRPVFWIAGLLTAGTVFIFWLTPWYQGKRLRTFRTGSIRRQPYTKLTPITQILFTGSLTIGASLAALSAMVRIADEHPAVRYRLALFDDLFNPELIRLRGGTTESWWDASSNLVSSILGMLDVGAWGKGLGRGGSEHIAKVSQDFMFSAIVGDWGAIGGLAILGILGFMFAEGLRVTRSTDTARLRHFGIVVISLFAAQILVTVLGSMGALPLTGITLPFLSAGYTSATTFGILFSLLAVLPEQGAQIKSGKRFRNPTKHALQTPVPDAPPAMGRPKPVLPINHAPVHQTPSAGPSNIRCTQ